MPPREFFRNTLQGTLVVALVLCVVCSLVVSAAAVALKGMQDANKALDKKKNVLLAAGFEELIKESSVDSIFEEKIRKELVDISTGEVLGEEQLTELGIDPEKYDSRKAAINPDQQVAITDGSLAGIAQREPIAEVYKIVDGDSVVGYVFPIYGKGLWSTLYGFISLESDKETVRGITYYSHAETPGLGGEVDNKNWKALWPGKKVYEANGDVGLSVIKGKAGDDPYGVDGLSGATITSNGVDNMIKYWLGDEAFGKYLANN